jgi:hypothetical protein
MSQARFIICPNCGLHGHYVLADGQACDEVTSQSMAIRQLQQLVNTGKVDGTDALRLIREVKTSSLMVNSPRNEDEALEAFIKSPVGPLIVLALAAAIVRGKPSDMTRRMGAFPG